MGKKIKLTYLAFHTAAFLYAVIGLPSIALGLGLVDNPFSINVVSGEFEWVFFLVGILSLSMAVLCEVVVASLKQERFWAWVAGVILSSLFVASIFLPLGVLGLIGLFEADTRRRFGS